MRKNNQVADFLTAFNQAFSTVNSVAQDYELGKIANAKPEQSQAFTEDQAQALGQAAAANPDGVAYNEDNRTYTVTPKADVSAKGDSVPVEPKSFAMQGVTDFLGKRSVGTMSDAQADAARQRAMAGVVMKSDPAQGMRMMRDVTQAERDDVRFGNETKRFENEQTMFGLNKDAAVRQAEEAKYKAAQDAAGRHVNEVLQQNGGDVRKAAAQIMTETNAGGLEGVKVSYEIGRDGAGRFVKTMPDGTIDAGQPLKPGAEGDLLVWQQITSAASDPKTIGSWYGDKLKRELDAAKGKQDQDNKERELTIKEQEAKSKAELRASQAENQLLRTNIAIGKAAAPAGVDPKPIDTYLIKSLGVTDANGVEAPLDPQVLSAVRGAAFSLPQAVNDPQGAAITAHLAWTTSMKKAGGDTQKALAIFTSSQSAPSTKTVEAKTEVKTPPKRPALTTMQSTVGPTYTKWMAAKNAKDDVISKASYMSKKQAEVYLASRLPELEQEIKANENYTQQ